MMNVTDKIAYGDYDNKLVYPTNPRKPAMLRNVTSAEALKYAQDLAVYEAEYEAYRVARTAYGQETARMLGLLKADLETEYNMVDHPKAEKLWAMAWEMGHSSGLGDVAIYYSDLYELVA